MEFGSISYAFGNTTRRILLYVVDNLVTGTESSSLERPLSDGSELIGDYNFRTDNMDCGTDPHGWYEDDI